MYQGWEGPSCRSDKDECQRTPDICGNITSSATNTSAPKVCVNTAGSYRCDCPPGLKGDDCDQAVNECEEVASPPCSNGGTCSNTVGSYRCVISFVVCFRFWFVLYCRPVYY